MKHLPQCAEHTGHKTKYVLLFFLPFPFGANFEGDFGT